MPWATEFEPTVIFPAAERNRPVTTAEHAYRCLTETANV